MIGMDLWQAVVQSAIVGQIANEDMWTLKDVLGIVLPLIIFLVLLIVQLKIVRTLNAHTSLIMFYGKQIEEIKKGISAGPARQRRTPEAAAEDHGLYEVLND